jgi:hypothetical protein
MTVMNEHDKSIVEAYCDKMDKKYNRLMNIIYGLIVAIVSAGAIQFISFGEAKAQIRINTEKLLFIDRNYVPTVFLDGFVQNQNYQTQEIVATIHGDPIKIKEINDKYLEFQKTMINQMIKFRDGISNVERGGSK